MREFTVDDDALSTLWNTCSEHFDERQRRIFAGGLARFLGRGGIVAVAEASGMSRSTVQIAVGQIDAGLEVTTRVRPPGAGRLRAQDSQPGLWEALDALVEPEARGDPMCPLRWTTKSTRTLAAELAVQGYVVSHETVAHLLHQMGYSLQATAKENEGTAHPDRDAQFLHLNDQVTEHLAAAQPVISIDAKKKEVLGNLATKGREWQPGKTPVRVDVHDFPDPKLGKAVPYGVYDVAANEGFVTVGADGDTAEFAVSAIARWWDEVGCLAYPEATRLLITADAGDPTDIAVGCGSESWVLWRTVLAWRSRCATCHRAHPSGTKSSIACSRRSR